MCTLKSNILLEDRRPGRSLDVPGYIHCTAPVSEMISMPGAIRKLVYSVSARTLTVPRKRDGI